MSARATAAVLLVAASCHDAPGATPDAATPAEAGTADGGGDAGSAPDAAGDAPPADAPFPADAAPPAATPAVRYLGGPILSAPTIVTVVFANDDPTLAARLAQFDDVITSTPWWSAVTAGYCVQPGGTPCVGPGAGAGHVTLPAADAAYTDSLRGGESTVRALLSGRVADGTLPAPDAQTLYVLYLPEGSRILLDGITGCAPSSFSGYHDRLAVTPPDAGAAIGAAYAVVARCSSTEAATTLQASHEIVEAATDPSPEDAPAFQMTDPAWTAFGPEVADVCAAVDADITTSESGFAVQRSWSNASAAAGHDPCVPAPAQPYFNVAPAQGTGTLTLAVGDSADVPLYPVADGPLAAWQVSGVAANGSPLLFSVQPATVTAGSHAVLTVTLASQPSLGVDQLYGIVSQSGQTLHVWPMIVRAK